MNKGILTDLIKKFKEKFPKGKSGSERPGSHEGVILKIFSPERRVFWHKFFLTLMVTVLFYTLGKLIAIKFSVLFIQPKPPFDFTEDIRVEDTLVADLNSIKKANLFHSKDEKAEETKKKKQDIDVICLESNAKSSLPYKLQDTIVLQDRKKSIAFISLQGQPLLGFRETEVIEKNARVDKISRLSVIFRNLDNGLCEYISNFDDQFEQMFIQKNLSILSPEAGKAILPNELKSKIRTVGNKYYLKSDRKSTRLNSSHRL